MPKLNIIQNKCYIQKTETIEDPVKKNQNHPSKTNIKDIIKSKIFPPSVSSLFIDKAKDIIETLNTKKPFPGSDVPVKLIKMNEDIFWRLIFQNFNQSLVNGKYPHCLKQAEVIPVFKNKEKLHKSNNRPVNILPVISRIYERVMYDQMFKPIQDEKGRGKKPPHYQFLPCNFYKHRI